MIKLSKLREGSVIMIRGSWGGGPLVKATVDSVEEDIKNGCPGIDYTDENEECHWAYLSQIEEVIKY